MSRFILLTSLQYLKIFQALRQQWARIAAAEPGRKRLSLFLINWADNLLRVLNSVGVCMLCQIHRRKEMQDRRRRRWWWELMNETWSVILILLNPRQEKEKPRLKEKTKYYCRSLQIFYSTKDYHIVSSVSMKLVLQFYSFRISRWEESAWNVRVKTVASPSCRPGASHGALFSAESEAASRSLRTGQIYPVVRGSFGGLEKIDLTYLVQRESNFLFYLLSAIQPSIKSIKSIHLAHP